MMPEVSKEEKMSILQFLLIAFGVGFMLCLFLPQHWRAIPCRYGSKSLFTIRIPETLGVLVAIFGLIALIQVALSTPS